MKNLFLLLILGALAFGMAIPQYGYASQNSNSAATLGTTFTYQGRLMQSDSFPTGVFDFRFILYDALSGGAQVGPIVTSNDLRVSDGYFVALLDFGGGAFNGQARWLEVGVRPGASNDSHITLSPRQALTATPNALYSQAAPWSGLSGVPTGFADGVDNDTTYSAGFGLSLSAGRFRVNTSSIQRRLNESCEAGSAIRVVYADGSVDCETDDNTTTFWSLTGNSGTNTATNYIGTNDDTALVLRVNGQPALLLAPHPNGPNVVGGYATNWLAGGVYAATLFGGGYHNGSGKSNAVFDIGGTVSGGIENEAGLSDADPSNAVFATVGGGNYNRANGPYSTVGGGVDNEAAGDYAAIGGGLSNLARDFGAVAGGDANIAYWYAAIGGGAYNLADGRYSTIGGGSDNFAGNNVATVGGGYSNTARGISSTAGGGSSNNATGHYSTVSGGETNTASGDHATVGGGYSNMAGLYSTVSGGSGNTANADHATAGGGLNNLAIGASSTIGGGIGNSTLVIASTVGGGEGNIAGVNASSGTIGGGWHNTVNGNTATVPGGAENTASGGYSFAAGAQANAAHNGSFVWSSGESTASYAARTFTVRAHGGSRFYTASGTSTGVVLPAGGGSWSDLSDRNAKENFQAVDAQAMLVKLVQLPITSWNYRAQDDAIRHLGPVAQDFSLLFGLGEDDTHISTVDADGVALAAIQGLYSHSQEQAAQIAELTVENTALKAQLNDIEARLASLERGAGVAAAPPFIWSYLPSFGLAALGFGAVLAWRRKAGGS